MSGATDAAFRRQVVRFGGPAVVSEMVAGEALRISRRDVVRRICRHEGKGRWIVQLAARRPEDMFESAKMLRELGVDMIDINMGCPARQVTGGRSGSALMREPALAELIMAAAKQGAQDVPVSLKMRLGWDDQSLNAPALAQVAQSLGLVMITVHGRTRCQFYKGQANWSAIADTVNAVDLPVICNGDIHNGDDARAALAASGAHGVMIGRAAMGQPWLIAEIAASLAGCDYNPPSLAEQYDSLCEQIEDSMALYGQSLGLKIVRKHISSAIERLSVDMAEAERRRARSELCQINDRAPSRASQPVAWRQAGHAPALAS
ncbi:MAG: tRNA dihydrouridine synthase, partial [Henriciella sp.]